MNLNKQVKVTLSDFDFMILEELTLKNNISKSEFIRQVLGLELKDHQTKYTHRKKKVVQYDLQLLYELNSINKRMIEIAHQCFINKYIDKKVLIILYEIHILLTDHFNKQDKNNKAFP